MPHQHSDEEISDLLIPKRKLRPSKGRLSPTLENPKSNGKGGRSWASVAGAAGVGCLLLLYIAAREPSGPSFDLQRLYAVLAKNTLRDGKCAIPRPDPWDPSISSYISRAEKLVCKSVQPDLTAFDPTSGTLALNASALALSGYSRVACSYQCFQREEGKDDTSLRYSDWVTFSEPVKPGCEFFHVSCSRSSLPGSIHSNVYSFYQAQPAPSPVPVTPSVLLFVLDSVSQSNGERNLPKLLRLLRSQFQAVFLHGYVKTADNSFPNAVAFLAGQRTCVQGLPDEVSCDNSETFFDDWPLIWKDYKKKGYDTYYAEDYPHYNLFSYLSNGFKTKPTDAYFRPFWLHAWPTFLHRRSTHLCFGSRTKLELQLDYLGQFLRQHRDRRFFGLNWETELGHDWLNQVAVGDEELASFFTRHSGDLENTILVVMSDHGHRFDAIRESVIGRIEERLPLFAISLPKALRDKHPHLQANLEANAERLTSHFDLYVTLRDILGGDYGTRQRNWTNVSPRGLSLLRPIPEVRSCAEAGISDEYCVCQHEQSLNVSEPVVVGVAEAVLAHVNTLLLPLASQCATLTLAGIRSAQSFLPNHAMVTESRKSAWLGGARPSGFFLDYRVALEVAPSGGILEAQVRQDDSGRFTVSGDVNRINKYGNQSDCIQDFILRKYCYCSTTLVPSLAPSPAPLP